jgi:hypothetical protein
MSKCYGYHTTAEILETIEQTAKEVHRVTGSKALMAFKWNKLTYCKAAYYASIRDKCVLDYVRDKKPDPYECFQIVDTGMRDACIYYHVDLYNRTGAGIKPTLCNLINNETLELMCNQTYLNIQ